MIRMETRLANVGRGRTLSCKDNANIRRQRTRDTIKCRVAQTSPAVLEQAIAWVTGNGASVDKVSPTTSLLSGNAILATARDISAGDTILSVPDAAWLSTDMVKRSAIGRFVADLEPWVQLSLFLVHARNGGKTDCAGFIGSLPSNLDSPLFWGDEELSMLTGTQLLQSVESYRAFFAQRFQQLQADVFAADPSAFTSDAYTYDSFLWAVGIIRSLVHAPLEGDKIALVPLASSLTHKRTGKARWSLKSAG